MEEQDGSPLRRSNSLKLPRNKHKVKSLNDDNLLLYKEQLGSSALSKKSEIAEVINLCFQQSTKEEIGDVLFKFWERLTGCTSMKDGEICEFDGVCMFVLDYVYEHDTVPFSAVSRSLFVYDWQNRLTLDGKNSNLNLKCGCFLNGLRQFTDFHADSNSEEMLVNICLGCISTGNIGLSHYLVKFGLIEFPTEVNEKCKKMFSILVNIFNNFSNQLTGRLELDDRQMSLPLVELLNKIKENKVNIRRSILIFCILVVAAEYKMYNELETNFTNLKFLTKHKKSFCSFKIHCIDLFLDATTETLIAFQDIENFIELFLNPFLTADIKKSLVDTSKKLLGEEQHYLNPRSLKDLARLKIRSSLKKSSMSIPEQVSSLKLPVSLKEFLTFHTEGIWEILVINHIKSSFEHELNSRTPEIDDANEQEIENDNVRELEAGNFPLNEDGDLPQLGDRGAREIED